jgi:hypothetical protein
MHTSFSATVEILRQQTTVHPNLAEMVTPPLTSLLPAIKTFTVSMDGRDSSWSLKLYNLADWEEFSPPSRLYKSNRPG